MLHAKSSMLNLIPFHIEIRHVAKRNTYGAHIDGAVGISEVNRMLPAI